MTGLLALFAIMLIPFAAAGLGLVHAGLGRSRSAAHALLATLCVLSVTAIVFVAVGFAWAGFSGGHSYSAVAGGVQWDWIGAERLFAQGVKVGDTSGQAGLGLGLVLCFHVFAVGLGGVIAIGAGADRWRLGSICLSSAIYAAIIYPLFAHWIWGGGWLSRMGTTFGLGGGFFDAGGSAAIQATGGLTALAIACILGPRRGKYGMDGMATAIPGHNIVLVLFGCILALVGWTGLNAAGAVIFYAVPSGRVILVVMNTMLAAAAAGLAALCVTRFRFGKPDATLTANGWVAGLVASSAGCAFIQPGEAILIGAVAGAVVPYAVELFELKLFVDDPGGSISVHAGAGLWGTFAAGIFAAVAPGSRGPQMLAQLVGVATLLGFVLPVTYGANWILHRILPQRVDRDGDYQGMDIRELGAGAYPEFVVHSDEFVPR
jgi:Amt family ammonium transporter